ncbi:DUF1868 domain-containing protein [Streptococcus merionis]|uniref:DUF1868 domain-containing protein n=1 Tax=Streptococcus merionis TaxID=400065 RepID=UPI00351630EB
MVNLTKVKFKENGDFNHFPGNTIVANLYGNEEVMKLVEIIQTEYRKLPFIDKFTLTQQGSIHMTVIELLCDRNRLSEYWSKDLSLELPIDEVSDYFAEKLPIFPLTDEKLVMRTTAMGSQNILVEPADTKTADRLAEIREYVSEHAGVRFPNHDNYQFHISVGYLRENLTEEEEALFSEVKEKLSRILLEKLPTISINRVDYTVFDDMTRFTPYVEKINKI